MKTPIPTIEIFSDSFSTESAIKVEPEIIQDPLPELQINLTEAQEASLAEMKVNPETNHEPFAPPIIQESTAAVIPHSAAETLPISFTLEPSYITAVKDQGACGSCWSFATYASLESSILMDGGPTEDFSENNLKNYHGFDWGPCDGGNTNLSIAYLSRGDGTVSEADDPYHDWDDRPSPGGAVQYSIGEMPLFDTDAEIKNALMNDGALYTSMLWDWAYFDDTTNNYYNYAGLGGGHAVAIVGWDDSRSIAGAPGTGAWLIKNSWGTDSGDNGYFWISYYDTTGANWGASFQDAVSPNTQDQVYFHDEFGQVSTLNSPYAVNAFTANGEEDLTTIGFFTQADGASYNLRIYDDFSGGTLSNLLTSESSTIDYAGYHTVDLSSDVPLTAGDDFYVYLHLTDGGTYPQAFDLLDAGYSSNSSANAGESYYSFNGTTWTDLTAFDSTANFAIKAFTRFSEEDAYEQNDDQGNAFNLMDYEQTWLSSIDGRGIANDPDWFRIGILPGESHLDIDVEFIDDNGDIDIQVYDENGNWVAGSTSTTDNEYIDRALDPGTYYANVYPYSDPGNTYNLRWDSVAQEDAYEQYSSNDTQQNAYWISGSEETWLSSIDGEGIANDHDYYAIEVSAGEERLLVDLQFTDADGDIDVVVYDADGNSVDASTSVTDNEFIDVNLSNPGTYYLDVYNYSGSIPGNTYDLLWLDHDPYGSSEADTIDGTAYQDTLYGYGGNDVLSGDQDRDKLYGGGGRDSLYGDQGNDKLFGQNGADKLFGGVGRDLLRGGNGIDRLYGQGGHDKLFGDNGNDRLFGGNGNDTLTGVAVNAASPGESDIDQLKGNAGADLFVLGDASQVYYEGAGSARILDFNISQNDVIQLYDSPALYQLSESLGNTRIELNNGELIGIVKDVTGLDLDDSYFSFV